MYLYLNISLLNRNRDIFKYKRDRNLLKNHYLMMFPPHEPGMEQDERFPGLHGCCLQHEWDCQSSPPPPLSRMACSSLHSPGSSAEQSAITLPADLGCFPGRLGISYPGQPESVPCQHSKQLWILSPQHSTQIQTQSNILSFLN